MSSNKSQSTFGYWVMTLLTVLFVSLFFCPALRVGAQNLPKTESSSVESLYRYLATRPERFELKVKIIAFGLKLKANGDDVQAVALVLQHDADQAYGLTEFAYILHESPTDPILAQVTRLKDQESLAICLRPDAAHLVEHKVHGSFPPAERLFELTENTGGDVL